jgi:hypothetical protein
MGLEDQMQPNDIKEQIIRLEGFGDGIKQGAALLAQWFLSELKRTERTPEPPKENEPQ